MKATIRPSTYNSYVQHVECHIAPHIGSVKLAKLTGSQVNALYAKLAESGSRDGKHGLSAMTIHHVHSCLHKACKDAVRWGHIAGNPLDAADPPRKKGDGTREMRTWTKEQLKAFLEAVKGERLYSLWHTIAFTGMRRGEALGLRWSDVDLENARLSVRRALIPTNREVVISEPKTAKGRRVVALDPVTIEVLKAKPPDRSMSRVSATRPGWNQASCSPPRTAPPSTRRVSHATGARPCRRPCCRRSACMT